MKVLHHMGMWLPSWSCDPDILIPLAHQCSMQFGFDRAVTFEDIGML